MCAAPGCGQRVAAIYCPKHRERLEVQRQEMLKARSENLKKLWRERGDEMRAKIKAGKAPAREGE